MTYIKDKPLSFPELADWVISQTKKAGARDVRVNISKRRLVEIIYRDRKPDVIKEATTQGLSLRSILTTGLQCSLPPTFANQPSKDLSQMLSANANIMEEDPFRTLPDPKYYDGMSRMPIFSFMTRIILS